MRLRINIHLEKPRLPKDYRSGFMSLIKAALEKGNAGVYHTWYGQRTLKPFTFSVYFPQIQKEVKGDEIEVGNKAVLNFSSFDPMLLAYIYNGIKTISSFPWKDYNRFTVEYVNLLPYRQIKKDCCVFKTLSPFLVNDKQDQSRYLTPDDAAFDDGLRHSINLLSQQFLGKDMQDFRYHISHHRKMVVSHYRQSMTAIKAIIEIQAAPEVLNLLYDVGIGVRRSQGFGMVELVK
ncbi:CRISPR-associated Cas6 family protein [Thermoflavifilum aggregans]|uniref:CRISPR-associated Cas6 family protein n=1 Tax=Thermoflavifilum aggregans TaxID=454188 RepID=A0A2M9CW90_9BACT|nr:CRISPR-associated endoribonuclease Cas6 [Thermoflavifilum aggregans]PJJ76159.1 CRISPR-associated Cas6 family protein [Thermoflavifilum aggregans]